MWKVDEKRVILAVYDYLLPCLGPRSRSSNVSRPYNGFSTNDFQEFDEFSVLTHLWTFPDLRGSFALFVGVDITELREKNA